MELLRKDHVRIVAVEVLRATGRDVDDRSGLAKFGEVARVVRTVGLTQSRLDVDHGPQGIIRNVCLVLRARRDRYLSALLAFAISAVQSHANADKRLAVFPRDPEADFSDP